MKANTSHFLAQMEAKRLQRPCPRVIDMRGKVPGECQSYPHEGRTHWLDDISYAIFRRGLEVNRGVLTYGVYEAIVDGPHTNRRLREAEAAQRAAAMAADETARRVDEPADGAAGPKSEAPGGPAVVTFGYNKRRNEERIEYATRLEIRTGDVTYWGKSRNLSVHGIMAYLRGRYRFEVGQAIDLTLPDMQAGAGPEAPFTNVRYVVMGTSESGTFHTLRLRLDADAAPPRFAEFVSRFIAGYRRRNKLDVADDARAAMSRVHERLFVENVVTLPLFVARNGAALALRAVASSTANGHITRFFLGEGGRWDLLPLALPERLARLADTGAMAVVLYRGADGHIYSADDGEFDDPEDFLRFAAHALRQPSHLALKIMAGCRPVRMPDADRFRRIARLLGEDWQAVSQQIREVYRNLAFTAAAVDVTTVLSVIVERSGGAPTPRLDGLAAWRGRERVELATERCLATVTEAASPEPAIAEFGLLRSRREARLLAVTPVELKLASGLVQASSRDLSLHGLCVAVKKPVAANVGDEILVGFPALQERRPNLNVMRIPYRVVKMVSAGEHLVMLQRSTDRVSANSGVDGFFHELIDTNRDKVAEDKVDLNAVAAANAFEAVAVENLTTIPIFFGRKDEEGMQVRAVGLAFDPCCGVADFFRNGEGGYDFSALATPQITLTLRDRFVRLQREGQLRSRRPDPATVGVYLYKSWDGEHGQVRFVGADDRTLAAPAQRAEFVRQALKHAEHRFLRVTVTYLLPMEESYRNELLRSIHLQATYEALQLDERFAALEGYGEVVDVTEELASAYGSPE